MKYWEPHIVSYNILLNTENSLVFNDTLPVMLGKEKVIVHRRKSLECPDGGVEL
jgi:hypothetical protein